MVPNFIHGQESNQRVAERHPICWGIARFSSYGGTRNVANTGRVGLRKVKPIATKLQNEDESRNINRARRLCLRHRQSEAMLGVAMAVIAMLFIGGIVAAFVHAADTSGVQHAANPPPASSETTGSGSSDNR
jgi:hypothetical protein